MKIKLLAIGKTDSKALEELIAEYSKRLNRYLSFDIEIIPDPKNLKNLSEAEQVNKEGMAILARLEKDDHVILLDERGKQFSSIGFSKFLQQKMNAGVRKLVFVIGGPYGLDPVLKERAMGSWSLSQLTFSHQMIRLFAIEQLYRAMTILKNQPYHHR